eukprot:985665-Pelagomonas_calceolata.AAC.1
MPQSVSRPFLTWAAPSKSGFPHDGPPRELRTRLDPGLAQRVHQHDRQVAAATAARPAPPPPRP